jgi:hypothetical protein
VAIFRKVHIEILQKVLEIKQIYKTLNLKNNTYLKFVLKTKMQKKKFVIDSDGYRAVCVRSIIVCVRSIIICVRSIIVCVRSIILCVRTIILCVRSIIVCVRSIIVCVRSIIICVLV